MHSDVTWPLALPSAQRTFHFPYWVNLWPMVRYTPIPSLSLTPYLVPLLPLSAATQISVSSGDRPTQYTPVYHPIPLAWLQIPIQARCPTKQQIL